MVTTVTLEADEEGHFNRMILDQVAEKDQPSCNDSQVIWETNGDFLTMSLEVYTPRTTVKAMRKFLKFKPGDKRNGTRKMSAPF